MEPDNPDDESDPPQEVDQGLAYVYGGDASPERAVPAADAADVGPVPSVLDRISETTGEKPGVSLRDAEPAGDTPMLKPLGPDDSRDAGKYVVHGELGRGGIGAVHRGHDQDLGRDVAMKFLHEKFKDQPAILHRFVEEAQIGGQLQHPGIVPVYDLGMSDGKPFFTMKLVKGKTLGKLLAGRESLGTDRRRFLSIFEQICQTIAYAHARGVVHRDLKPTNVMIGAFGEVQVVDWGMGKVLERSGGADELPTDDPSSQPSVIETVRSSRHGTQSVMGSIMGTPAYMPPEQATAARSTSMDERSDVFALGAILCEILTDEPPYVGARDDLIGMAAMSQLEDAHHRLAQCGADAQLVELTEQCLLASPAARPKSAEAVAKRIHDYLAQAEAKIHEAQVTAAGERVRASTARSRQRLALGLVGVVLLGLLASLWFWRDAETQRCVAETNLANFNRLAHLVKLRTAQAEEQELYPAWPTTAERMRAWLEEDAKDLVGAVPQLQATLDALRVKALPWTEAGAESDRRAHPRFAELETLRGKLAAHKRAREVKAGRLQVEAFALDEVDLQRTAPNLNELAWPLVAPNRRTFGQEAEGLALARRAVAVASADDEAPVTDTLAWALHANGLDREAAQASQHALDAAEAEKAAHYRDNRQRLQAAITAGHDATAQTLEAAIVLLEAEVGERRTFGFAAEADSFLHDALAGLVTEIATFEDREISGVEQRLTWAERIDELTVERHRARWNQARLAIIEADGATASQRYREVPIELMPQLGLIPMGTNPRTRLWEFYHLRSACDPTAGTDPASVAIPTHRADGTLAVTGELGLVFVLVPGGTFQMGAQCNNPDGSNYDPGASPDEYPVHSVTLAPFFMARYEMTQAQWARLKDSEFPSSHRIGLTLNGDPAPAGPTHPVEFVSWAMCDTLLRRHGLTLPTEAQWEYGCRAGTSTPWSTGATPSSLAGYANVMDETAVHHFPSWGNGESFDDGWSSRAPVGTYAANPFGLFDVHGNVHEWCRDAWGKYTLPMRERDGLRDAMSAGFRVARSGYSRQAAHSVRCSHRARLSEAMRNSAVGVRATRGITVR